MLTSSSAKWLAGLALACATPPTAESPVSDVEPPTEVTQEIDIGTDRVWAPPAVHDVADVAGAQGGWSGHFQRGRACVAADLNNDGRTDLYVGNPGDDSYFVLNETEPGGPVTFGEPVTLRRGGLPWGAAAADYDNDGDIDIYVSSGGNEGRGFDVLLENQWSDSGEVGFEDASAEAGIRGLVGPNGAFLEGPSANGVWADFDQDGWVDLFVNTNQEPTARSGWWVGRNFLWRNQGDGTFRNVASDWGLAASRYRTRHSSVLDYDNDGDLDLYENNFRGPNILWHNQLKETGEASFYDVTEAQSTWLGDLSKPNRSFASAAGDVNNDGWEDIIVYSRGMFAGDCGTDEGEELDEGVEGHGLFLNLGHGRGFVEVAETSRINGFLYNRSDTVMFGDGVMGAQAMDINGDGLLDLFMGNGGPLTGTANELYVADSLVDTDFGELGQLAVPVYQDWSHLIDSPAPRSTAIETSQYAPYPYRTHGSCAADFDGDGLLELLVTNGGPEFMDDEVREPDRLFDFSFDEQSRPNALFVKLEGDGDAVSRDAIGALVRVTVDQEDGSTRRLQRRLYGGSGFSAQNDVIVHFGLGFATAVRDVEVVWPDGVTTSSSGPIPLDSTWTIRREDAQN